MGGRVEMKLPNSNTYWAVPGKLLAGEYPRNLDIESSLEKLQAYLDLGVSYFLDLTEEGELALYADLLPENTSEGQPVIHRRFAIRDKSVPDSAGTMREILDAIQAALHDGHTVYVHCWGGVGRTGTVIGCYLVEQGNQPDDAIAQLDGLWQSVAKVDRHPHSPETSDQRQWILSWRQL